MPPPGASSADHPPTLPPPPPQCRLCQKNGCMDVTTAAFELAGESLLLRDAYRSFGSLAIGCEHVDAAIQSLHLCFGCTNELVTAYTFLAKVLAAEERLGTVQLASAMAAEAAKQQLQQQQQQLQMANETQFNNQMAAQEIVDVDGNDDDHMVKGEIDYDDDEGSELLVGEFIVGGGSAGHSLPIEESPDEPTEYETMESSLDNELTAAAAIVEHDHGNDMSADEIIHVESETYADDEIDDDNTGNDNDADDAELHDFAEYIEDDEPTSVSANHSPIGGGDEQPEPVAPVRINKPQPVAAVRALSRKRPAINSPETVRSIKRHRISTKLDDVLVPQFVICDLDVATRTQLMTNAGTALAATPNNPDDDASADKTSSGEQTTTTTTTTTTATTTSTTAKQPFAGQPVKTIDVYARRLSQLGIDYLKPMQDRPANWQDHPADRTGKTVFMCRVCTKSFTTVMLLLQHVRKNHTCQFCLAEFRVVAKMFEHIRREHHGNFVCPLCECVFRGNSNLRDHLRKVHEMALPPSWSILSVRELAAGCRVLEEGEEAADGDGGGGDDGDVGEPVDDEVVVL